MEGGAIDVNGRGTLLATEECLLSEIQARNPALDRGGLEKVFADFLGVNHVVWLGSGIDGDDTHGHVDDIARFVGPHTVVTVVEPRTDDPNHLPLADNLRRLQAAHDQDGQRLQVVELPMPAPVVFEGQRLPASYANFYIANGIVLVPTFNDPADRTALGILADYSPSARSLAFIASTSSSGSAPCTAYRSSSPKAQPAKDHPLVSSAARPCWRTAETPVGAEEPVAEGGFVREAGGVSPLSSLWKSNSNSVRHFSPGWGIEMRACRRRWVPGRAGGRQPPVFVSWASGGRQPPASCPGRRGASAPCLRVLGERGASAPCLRPADAPRSPLTEHTVRAHSGGEPWPLMPRERNPCF